MVWHAGQRDRCGVAVVGVRDHERFGFCCRRFADRGNTATSFKTGGPMSWPGGNDVR